MTSRLLTRGFNIFNVKYIDISVLQGSILGALLFLVFRNDLPRSSNAKNSMCKEKSLELLEITTENEINKVALLSMASNKRK